MPPWLPWCFMFRHQFVSFVWSPWSLFVCFFSPSGSLRHHHVATRGKYGLVECVALSVCSCSLSVDLEEEAANVAACCAASPILVLLFLIPHNPQLTHHCRCHEWKDVSRRRNVALDGDTTGVPHNRGKINWTWEVQLSQCKCICSWFATSMSVRLFFYVLTTIVHMSRPLSHSSIAVTISLLVWQTGC